MKTRLDEPHLSPLRHDYRLLHEAYRDEGKDSAFWTVMLIFGWICLVTAIGAIAMTVGGL